jgi:uncharacterized protein YgbK (DUF1537 family)
MLIGIIADDMTGATDVAAMLRNGGMSVVQAIGAPEPARALPDAEAVVVALKSRTAPVAEAVAWSLAACDRLRAGGARQILFKVCSTFDSTAEGNIGPVAEALMERLGAEVELVCPAFPANGRTVVHGRLFVGADPLDETPMRDHPLTPMRDSSLVRLMAAQSRRPVGRVGFADVAAGTDAVRAAVERERAAGKAHLVADALTDAHLVTLGEAAADHVLLTGGSGIALGLPANFRRAGLLRERAPERFAAPPGRALVLAGSCSRATLGQIEAARAAGLPVFALDPLALAEGRVGADDAIAWIERQGAAAPAVVASTAPPEAVGAAQARLGREAAGRLVEDALAAIARRAVERGVTRLVVAGGETSGAVVQGLGVRALAIGPDIAPGVPWTRVADGPPVALALKSGNFGGPDFFADAFRLLEAQ